ncbi:MAG: hypothetical protein M0R77_14715 [Gammaproteobacteria bacterium]|nr:hypothetical protein [Gammaproteobacteria bacterium]
MKVSGTRTPETARDWEATALLPTCEGCEVNLFAQFFEDGGEEVLDSFELVDASYSAKSQTLTATLSADLFTHRRTNDATFEAIVLLGVRQRGEVR